MTEIPTATSAKITKLNRVERNAWTKRRIFDAATRIVGQYGYAEASVARITEQGRRRAGLHSTIISENRSRNCSTNCCRK